MPNVVRRLASVSPSRDEVAFRSARSVCRRMLAMAVFKRAAASVEHNFRVLWIFQALLLVRSLEVATKKKKRKRNITHVQLEVNDRMVATLRLTSSLAADRFENIACRLIVAIIFSATISTGISMYTCTSVQRRPLYNFSFLLSCVWSNIYPLLSCVLSLFNTLVILLSHYLFTCSSYNDIWRIAIEDLSQPALLGNLMHKT